MQTELMLTSNELSVMFRMMTTHDLCDFLRHQYKCYRIQYFACMLQYKFQYIYISAISTLYIRSFMLYQKLKMKAAVGNDGITAKMMNREVFIQLWWELFNWCWRSGMVPSMWKSSMVGPLPRTRSKGACRTEELRGVATHLRM